MKKLCVCIDDYGLHEGINNAALELTEQGRVHAVSCMTAAPAWAKQAARLQAAKVRGVGIGLHLDFTEKLADSYGQMRMPLATFIRKAYLRQHSSIELRAEIVSQLNAFEDATGYAPSYVDGHQHVHQLPQVRTELLSVLRERYSQAKPWLRSTVSAGIDGTAGSSWASGLDAKLLHKIKPWGIELLGAHALRRMATKQGFSFNQRLLGVYDFQGGQARYAKLLATWCELAKSGDLLMCHPSMSFNAQHTSVDELISARQAEFAVWRSEQVLELLHTHQIELAAMRFH